MHHVPRLQYESIIIILPTPLNGTKLMFHRGDEVNTHSCNPQWKYNGRTSHMTSPLLVSLALGTRLVLHLCVYVWVRDLKPGAEDEAPRGMCNLVPRHNLASMGELERISAGSQGRRVN